MTKEEFEKRYSKHPVGMTFKAFEEANSWRERHIYFIMLKAMIHLLKFQDQLTPEDEQSLLEMLDRSTDEKLGKDTKEH